MCVCDEPDHKQVWETLRASPGQTEKRSGMMEKSKTNQELPVTRHTETKHCPPQGTRRQRANGRQMRDSQQQNRNGPSQGLQHQRIQRCETKQKSSITRQNQRHWKNNCNPSIMHGRLETSAKQGRVQMCAGRLPPSVWCPCPPPFWSSASRCFPYVASAACLPLPGWSWLLTSITMNHSL